MQHGIFGWRIFVTWPEVTTPMFTGWGHPSDWLVWPPALIGLWSKNELIFFPNSLQSILECVHRCCTYHIIVHFAPPVYNRSERKPCRRSLLIFFFFIFHVWPRIWLVESISKNVIYFFFFFSPVMLCCCVSFCSLLDGVCLSGNKRITYLLT